MSSVAIKTMYKSATGTARKLTMQRMSLWKAHPASRCYYSSETLHSKRQPISGKHSDTTMWMTFAGVGTTILGGMYYTVSDIDLSLLRLTNFSYSIQVRAWVDTFVDVTTEIVPKSFVIMENRLQENTSKGTHRQGAWVEETCLYIFTSRPRSVL